jgi:hypothetical protein
VQQVTRPKVDSVSPGELVELARRGQIRVPSFQRSYRWDRHDVTELFDSIFHGYPIGNLLVWQRPAPPGLVNLGHLQVQADASGDAYWVVDGQQRITSLVGALTANADTVDPRFRIYFDLDRGNFVSAARNHRPPQHWLPVSLALDTALANAWIRDRPSLDKTQAAQADQVVAAIRDYKIPIYIVTTDDEQALREIFDRMNTFGKPLRRAEVFNALHSVQEDPTDLRALSQSVRSFGFGDFPERVLMQSLLAIRDARVDRDFRDEFDNSTDRHEAFLLTQQAIGLVVDFLRERAEIPHFKLVPYSLYIPVLCRYAASFGAPTERAAELLRRWVWRGAVLGVAPQGNTIGIRQNASAIYGDPVDSANRLLDLLPSSKRGAWHPDLSKTSLNQAQAKVNILGMLSCNPLLIQSDGSNSRQLVNVIDLLEQGRVLVPIVSSTSHLAEGLANRMIYPAEDAEAARMALMKEGIDTKILESHCLDQQAVLLLQHEEIEDFLILRASLVKQVIEDHIQAQALFGFRDGPDLPGLFDDSLEDTRA